MILYKPNKSNNDLNNDRTNNINDDIIVAKDVEVIDKDGKLIKETNKIHIPIDENTNKFVKTFITFLNNVDMNKVNKFYDKLESATRSKWFQVVIFIIVLIIAGMSVIK